MVFVATTELSGNLNNTAVATGNVFRLLVPSEMLILASWHTEGRPNDKRTMVMIATIFNALN